MESKLGNGELFDANECTPFTVKRRVYVAKEEPTQDSNKITICFSDDIHITEEVSGAIKDKNTKEMMDALFEKSDGLVQMRN